MMRALPLFSKDLPPSSYVKQKFIKSCQKSTLYNLSLSLSPSQKQPLNITVFVKISLTALQGILKKIARLAVEHSDILMCLFTASFDMLRSKSCLGSRIAR